MRRVLSLVLCTLLLLIQASLGLAQVSQEWVRRYSGPGNDTNYAIAMAVDSGGNVIVTGESVGSGTGSDFATIKYDPSGNQVWLRRYNGPANARDLPAAVAVDGSGNVYVTGYAQAPGTDYDYVTIKYSPAGTPVWEKRYDGPGNSVDVPRAMALDSAGNVYVTGHSRGTTTSDDYATIKYDAAGNQVWVKRYSGTGENLDVPRDIEVDNAGNVYITGVTWQTNYDVTTIKYNSAGDQVWIRHYNGGFNGEDDANALAIDSAGSVIVTGRSDGSGTASDFLTIKYDSAGNQLWVRRYDGPANSFDNAIALAVDGAGSVYITGNSLGSGTRSDCATVKYNSAGDELWVRRYNGPGNGADSSGALALDPFGNVYISGDSLGSGTDYDAVTVKYDFAGNQVWVQRYNSPQNGYEDAGRLVVDRLGNVYTAGSAFRAGTSYDFLTIKYRQPPGVAILLLNPSTVVGGEGGVGTVSLQYAAHQGGQVVSLTSNSSAVTVPASVTVPAGATSAMFNFSTGVVSATAARLVTASANGVSRSAWVTLQPGGLLSFTVNPTNLTAGASSTGTIRLSGPARTGGTPVTITPNTTVITAPGTVTVPSGQMTATFTLQTSYMSTRATRTVTARLGAISKVASLTIAPAYDLVVNPSTVQAGQNTTARVTIPNAAPAGGATIPVSTNSSALVVPSSVTIPAGQYSVLFTIGTKPVGSTVGRYVTVNYNGVNKSVLVTITP
jgi:uncharacterized delta-60 repeat protein